MISKTLQFCIASLCLMGTAADAVKPAVPQIGETLARKLASEAYFGSAERMKWFIYDGDDVDRDSPFFGYLGIAPIGDGSFGDFAVNKMTGDVWDTRECKIISTPASDKLQAQIRKRFTPEEMKQHDQFAAIKPGCLND